MGKKRISKKNPQSRLESAIEQTSTSAPTLDGVDPGILDHVEHFFSAPLPLMQHFSLETQEGAREAIAIIEEHQKVIQERLKTARMLKTLCETAQVSAKK